MTVNAANRPRFLDLRKIHLPLPGILSILHRVSGLILFLSLPYSLYLLDLSLSNEAGFMAAATQFNGLLFQLVSVVLVWSISHHFFAGIRYLLLDMDIWIDRDAARQSSIAAFIASLLLTMIVLGVIW